MSVSVSFSASNIIEIHPGLITCNYAVSVSGTDLLRQCMCWHTEVADQTCCLIQWQYTDNGPTNSGFDSVKKGSWQDSRQSMGVLKPRERLGWAKRGPIPVSPVLGLTPCHEATEAVYPKTQVCSFSSSTASFE